MSNVPAELKYASSHEWVRAEGEGIYRVGISDHAQALLGDMVHIELPNVDDEAEATIECAVAESVKAAADIYAPISGKIVEVNKALSDAPGLVNSAPYTEGWLFCIKASNESEQAELAELLDAADYRASLEE